MKGFKNILLGKGILLFLFFLSCTSLAQKTMIFTDLYRDYRNGQELYDKMKYSAALDKFGQIVQEIENPLDELRVNAEYYYAVCALELFNLDAEVLLSRFVLEHPDHPKSEKVYFQLGKYYSRQKSTFKKAIHFYSKVDPFDLTAEERIEFHFKLGYALFTRKKIEESRPHFKEVLAHESEFKAPATYYYSHIAYTDENLQTALDGFQSIASNKMFKSIVPYYITQILYKQEKYDDLIAYAPPYMDSVDKKRHGEFAKLIADSYYYNQSYDDAISYYKIFKKNVRATRDDNYQIGYSYYRTGDFKNAVRYLMRCATKKDGLSQTAYYHMADAYMKSGDKEYAMNAFQEASKLDFDPEIKQNSLFNYAKLAYELSYNPYDEAIEAFHEYIDTYPESEEVKDAYEFLIKVYLTTKNYDDALNSLDRIKNKDDRMKTAYQTIVFNRGVELFHNQSYQIARDHFASVKKYPINQKLNSLSIYWMAESSYKLADYNQAITYYNAFRVEPGALSLNQYDELDYNIGYAYFKRSRPFKESSFNQIQESNRALYLNKSIEAFRKYIQHGSIEKTNNLLDANLRIADCYFLLKEDQLAIEYYSKAIEIGEGNLSYAFYQKATAQGLVQDYEGKVSTLSELTQLYPNSKYQIVALLNLAQTYNDLGENQKSINIYKDFIAAYPTNNYVSNALVEIGSIHLKEKKYDEAEKYFLQVLQQYPDAESENSLAIELMKEVYEGRDDLPGYYNWLNSKGIQISVNERDSTLWVPVQQAWEAGDCNLQIEKANEYLSNIPNPSHEIKAHFYIANCHYANGRNQEALLHYNFIIDRPNNNYYAEVLRYAGDISFGFEDYNQSLGHYSTLEKVSMSENDIHHSVVGQMRSFWNLKSHQSCIDYCDKVLSISDLDEPTMIDAYVYKGICLKELHLYDEAIESLEKATEITKSIQGAKAKYHICEIFYLQEKYEACENEIMELVQQKPSYDYWLAKAIILLGDNFVALGDYFNAKHSLQSIIDNYDGPEKAEMVKIAQEKIDEIILLENSDQGDFEDNDVEIDFNEVDQKDKELFDDEDNQSSDDNPENNEEENEN
tara:strand:+ start:2716 stop:5943 length:3228 start_codon:yes stop_codon:yes gene_type:complete